MTNTDLAELLVGQPPDVQAEIIRINTEARPLALQVALLVPIIAEPARARELVPDDASNRIRSRPASKGCVLG